MQVSNATMGIITLLLAKSNISRKVIPPKVTWLSAPNPKVESRPNATEPRNTTRQAAFLFQPSLSQTMDTTVSIKEMEDVIAAKKTSRKNTAPIILPPGIA